MTTVKDSSRRTVVGRVLDSSLFYKLATFGCFALLWQFFAASADSLLIPTFTGTVTAFGSLTFSSELWAALAISNQALVIGFSIAVVLGIPLGLAMGRFPAAEKVANVYINILLISPMAVLVPLLIMSVGIGLTARVILIVLFSLIMILVNCRAGVRQVDGNLVEMARSFGSSEYQIWRHVLLPGAMPAVMTGIRIGLGRAVEGMVIVELLMVSVGLGGLILEFRGRFEPELLYATVVFVIIEAMILITAARWLERRLTPWSRRPSLVPAMGREAGRK